MIGEEIYPVREVEPTERRKERDKWGKQAIRFKLSECLRNWGQWEGPPYPNRVSREKKSKETPTSQNKADLSASFCDDHHNSSDVDSTRVIDCDDSQTIHASVEDPNVDDVTVDQQSDEFLSPDCSREVFV